MNLRSHRGAKRAVDGAVTFHGTLTADRRRDNQHAKVPATRCSSGMSYVPCAFVLNLEVLGSKALTERCFDPAQAVHSWFLAEPPYVAKACGAREIEV
jgi:hypothetical protein